MTYLVPSGGATGRLARVDRELVRQTNSAIQLISAQYQIALVEAAEASSLYRHIENDAFSAATQTVQDIRVLPEAALLLQPLIREYGAILADIQRRASR